MKSIIKPSALLLALIMCLTVFLTSCNQQENNTPGDHDQEKELEERYNSAHSLIEEEKYEEAYVLFKNLGDYKDSAKELKKFRYVPVAGTNKTMLGNVENSCALITVSYYENNLPKQILFSYPGSDQNTFDYTFDYTFDDNGNLTREIYTELDGDRSIYIYSYDDKGNLVRKSTTLPDGESLCVYTYDDNGRLTTEICEYASGGSTAYSYTYDDKGTLDQVICTASAGGRTVRDYSYDSKGNLAKIVYTFYDYYNRPEGSKNVDEYTYDDKGNLVERIFTYYHGDKYSYAYIYDDSGNLTKETYTDVGKVTYKNEYTYDDNGIPVKRTSTGFLDTVCELNYKLVYIPFELSDEEFEMMYMGDLGFYSYKNAE